jgi:hypothetical protein
VGLSAELTALRWSVDERIATVWLHRPHRHNAWTGTMHTEYRQVMADLEHRDDVRAVVVTGTPPAFCVGGDSKALEGHVDRGGYDSGLPAEPATPGGGDRLDADFVWQLGYRLPIIAAVNGACAGVGLALALWCDLRFVAADAKLTTAAAKLGLPAGVRDELDPAPTRRSDPGERPAPVEPGRHRRRDRRLGPLERRRGGRRRHARRGARLRPVARLHDRPRPPSRTPSASSPPICSATTRPRRSPTRCACSTEAMGTAEYREGIRALTEKRPPAF